VLASSSGKPATTTTLVGGLPGSVAVLPISGANSVDGVTLVGNSVDGTSPAGAFVQPITGNHVLTGMEGSLTTTTAQSLVGTTLNATIQLYTSPPGLSTTFVPVPGAQCQLSPSLTGVLPPGTIVSCQLGGLNIPLADGTRAILVASTSASGVGLVNVTTGYWSAGLQLD
jgi:BclB C-terminal domain-containing protein